LAIQNIYVVNLIYAAGIKHQGSTAEESSAQSLIKARARMCWNRRRRFAKQ